MEALLLSYGLHALFFVSFLAASIVPVGSEWLLVALLAKGGEPVPAVAVATAGNVLGACTTYAIGLWGSAFIIAKVLRMNDVRRQQAARIFSKWGSAALLFSWLPVVGDALCLVGGVFRIRFFLFVTLVAAGKLARYAAIAWMVESGKAIFS